MPYSSNNALPPAVRNSLPDAAQTVFRGVVNNRLAAGQSDQRAFRQGWAVVNQNWRKPKTEGKWVAKWVAKGYPEYSDDQARGNDGQWTAGGGGTGDSDGSSSASKPAGESGLHRAGRYALTAGALIAAIGLGVVAAPTALRLARSLRRARGGASIVTASKLKEAVSARTVLMNARAKSADLRAYSMSRLAYGRLSRAQVRNYERDIKLHTKLHQRFSAEIERLDRQIRSLSRSKKRATTRKRYAPMYVCRPLLNTQDLVEWAKSQGFDTTIDPEDLHVTLAYSKAPVDWPAPQNNKLVLRPSSERSVETLGDAVVLRFDSPTLAGRWQEFKDAGASWDHDKYNPHVTITYQAPEGLDPASIEPYKGELIFGPEQVKPFEKDIAHVEKLRELVRPPQSATSFSKSAGRYKRLDMAYKALKTSKDGELGLIFGWAIISTENGKPYYDTQGDYIPDDSMLRAAAEFMESKRTMKVMHNGKKVGTVVFAWPVTQEIAQAMGLKTKCTGLMVAVKPDSPRVLERFKNKQYTGFSIGGNRLEDEDVEDETQKALTFKVVLKGYPEFEEDQARGEGGKWTAGGAARGAATAAGIAALGLGGASAIGMRSARALLPGIRRAVLARRVRAARAATGRSARSYGTVVRTLLAQGKKPNRAVAAAMLSATGHENPMVNALRALRNTYSAAARRRAYIRASPRSF